MKKSKRFISAILVVFMLVSMLPVGMFAADGDTLETSLAKAQAYIDGLTVNNDANDPTTVVSNFGTQFSWDTEMRESNNKSYLFEWSYYNGVVFEGLDYVADATGDTKYSDYVEDYLAAMINGNTAAWKKCTNNSSKEAAGYNKSHGLDCYKTASMLLDYGYTAMAAQLYSDLQNAEASYTKSSVGGNFAHTWSTTPSYYVWLDGIYMAQPFMAEYAASINDTAELARIADRFAWIGNNMYNSSTGLYYHAANSASNHSSKYWSRAIGWYAAALVDVLPYVDNSDMRAQLKQLVDGMLPYQDPTTGLWRNFVNESGTQLETSGTALVAYAIMKGVNNGWLDESYAEYAIKAFNGICNNKLNSSCTSLSDICTKGSPDGSNNTFAANEGKGVGPFIMTYAELLKYTAGSDEPDEPDEPDDPDDPVDPVDPEEPEVYILNENGETIDCTVTELEEADNAAVFEKAAQVLSDIIAAYDLTFEVSGTATVKLPIPEDQNTENLAVYYIPETGDPVNMNAVVEDGYAVFTTDHNSVYILGIVPSQSATGTLPGGYVYTRVSTFTPGEQYLIVNGDGNALLYVNGSSTGRYTSFTVSNNTITLDTDAYGWTIGEMYTATPNVTCNDLIASNSTSWTAAAGYYYKVGNNYYPVYAKRSTSGTTMNRTYTYTWGYSTTGSANNVTQIGQTQSTRSTGTTASIADSVYQKADGYSIEQNGKYLNSGNTISLANAPVSWTVTARTDSAFRLYNGSRYLRYNSNNFSYTTATSTTGYNLRLYQLTSQTTGATVNFSVNYNGTTPLNVNDTAELTPVITLNPTAAVTSSTITWRSSNTSVATVDANGVVTPVADGTARITATLSAVNGKNLTSSISVTVTVTVATMEYEASLSVNPETATLNIYNEDTLTIHPTVGVREKDSGDAFETADSYEITWSSSDTSVATVDANGKVTPVAEGTATITATVTKVNGETPDEQVSAECEVTVINKLAPLPEFDYDGYEEADKDPQYPADGAVRIHKTADGGENFTKTGVTKVELDVAGISAKAAVDVVLVVDVSNSMGWSVENAGNSDDSTRKPTGDQTSKLQDAMTSASKFAEILLKDEGNNTTDNTITFVTFAGYSSKWNNGSNSNDKNCVDSVQTPFVASQDLDAIKTAFSNTTLTYDTSVTGSWRLTIGDLEGGTIVNGGNRGDTNYDYAFYQANAAIEEIKAQYDDYDATGREISVVFMTDGAPSHYNNRSTSGRYSSDCIPGSKTTAYGTKSSDQVSDKAVWYSDYMMGGANTYATTVFNKADAGFYTIGFDMAHGGFGSTQWTEEQLEAFLNQVIEDESDVVVLASDTEELESAYGNIAKAIKNAGEKAQARDVIGENFTLQIGNTIGTGAGGSETAPMTDYWGENVIEVKEYDLYTKAETTDMDLIGTRKGTYNTVETVSFNEDGTEAYSSVLGEDNILTVNSDGTVKIDAYTFTYTKDADGVESFTWKIGSITEKEIALSFYAYLKGALEGEADRGTYYTNEEATLDYIDIYDKHAQKTFEVPAVVWGGATTKYEFYLVNYLGQPVNSLGQVVPYANRIIIVGPDFEEIYLNSDLTIQAQTIRAKDLLPIGYYLYDEEASYVIESSTLHGGTLTISEPSDDAFATKGGLEQTGAQTTKRNDSDNTCMQTYVSFGVRYDVVPLPNDFALTTDVVVVDYGLPVSVHILPNDIDIDPNATATPVGFVKYQEGADLTKRMLNKGETSHTAAFGTFTLGDDNTVVYTMSKMISATDRVFCVVKIDTHDSEGRPDTYYLYEELDIVPATTVYYEDTFVNFEGSWTAVGENEIAPQCEDRPGFGFPTGMTGIDANNVYGYDPVNGTYTTYSLGGAMKTTVDGSMTEWPAATFTFTGSGFDLISLTDTDQGFILIQVYEGKTAEGTAKYIWGVDNYYGYDLDGESDLETADNDTLYQIPVVKSTNIGYGTYTVVITPVYNALLDHDSTGSYSFYLDAVRIYDPVYGDEFAEGCYLQDKEAFPQYIEIRDSIISQKAFETSDATVTGAVFIDDFGNEGGTVSDYENFGPNNEVYLAQGQSVAFRIDATNAAKVASVQIGAKGVEGNVAYAVNGETSTLTTCTDMYYDITGIVSWNGNESDTITVTNTGANILSLTNIKITYTDNPVTPAKLGMSRADAQNAAQGVHDFFIKEYDANGNVFLRGDVNGDGAVNAKDLLILRKYLANDETSVFFAGADADGDGVIGASDVIEIRRILAEIEEIKIFAEKAN